MGAIYGSSYYTIVNGPTWLEAAAESVNRGGHLATINTEEEDRFIEDFLNNYFSNLQKINSGNQIYFIRNGEEQSSDVWIGLSDSNNEGSYTWQSGQTVEYIETNELYDDNGLQDYVALRYVTAKRWGWDDQENDDSRAESFGRGDIRYSNKVGIAEIPLSYFSIADASFREGTGGDITITRTGGTTTSQTIKVKSSDGTATTDDDDYAAINTTVSFAAGETSKTISVSTTADLDVEDDETFNLTITAEGTDVVPPQISDGTATVTIKADDFRRGDSLYTIVDGPSWVDSERAAQKLGGSLVTIESVAENEYITEKYLNETRGSHNNKWIGLSDQESEGTFKWSNKSEASYRNWAKDEPNGGRGENYVHIMYLDSRGKGVWNDGPTNPKPDWSTYTTEGIAEISLKPKPTYSLSTSTTSIDEKSQSSVRTTISTTGVDSGTRLYYTLSGSGITSSDFSFGDIKNSRLIDSSGTASFLHTAAADKTTEGSESFTIKLYTDYARTNLVATSESISINDTSITPTYLLSLTPSSIDEGDSFRAAVTTTGVAEGTTLYYAIKGSVIPDDFTGNSKLTGNITVDSSGKASFTRKTIADKLTEGSETARVLFYSDRQRTVQVGDAASVTINDTSITPSKSSYSIDLSPSNVKEGDILNSTITTTNVDPGTRLYWSFTGSGINSSDFSSGSLQGSTAIDKSGEFSLTHAIAEDKTTEGTETLKLQLFSDANRRNLLTQSSLTIRDTSTTPQTANLTVASVKANLLTLYFDGSLASTTPNTNRFSLRADGDELDIYSSRLKANAGTLELTLASSVKPNQSVRLSYSDLKGDQSSGVLQTPDGTDVESFSTAVTNTNKDKQPPKVTAAFIKDKTLTLSFSEDISSATPSNRTWTVKEDGTAIPVVFSNVDTSTAQLDLQLSTAVDAGSSITLSYSDLAGNQNSNVIEDLAGNDLASISNLAVTNRTQRSTQPLNVNTAEIDGDSITIAFDRELATTTPNTGTFRVTANGKAIKVTGIKLKPDSREALLTLKSPVAFGESVGLSYTDAQGNQNRNVIEDLDGNDLATLSNLTVTNNTRKAASDLKLDYADADGSVINLFFTDTLSGSIPKASRFRVTANKRMQRIGSVTTDPAEGIVSLNLQKPISSDQDILISYRDLNGDQASGVIEDLDGNDLPSFSKLAPINDSIDNDPPALEDAYLDGKELVLEFDELIQAGKLSKSRFKVGADKKRIRVISAEVQEDDAVAIINLKKNLPASTSSLSLTYKDLKGDQNSSIIQDLDGNDLESFRNFDVEII
jgi:uncharacterized repeat protein (TIGR02059 family)